MTGMRGVRVETPAGRAGGVGLDRFGMDGGRGLRDGEAGEIEMDGG